MKNWTLTLALLATASGLLAMNASANVATDAADAQTAEAAPAEDAKPVNAKCPIMGGKAKATVTTTWNEKTIGFCCPPCIKKWAALSEAEKATKLAAAMK